MLKMLRFDFYKIFKSKALLSVFIVTLGLAVLDPLLTVVRRGIYLPFLEELSQWTFLDIMIIIFIVPFVCKDFSSKFIKNTYSSYSFADKIYYVLSKVIYICAVCVIWFLLRFVTHLIINAIQSAVFNCKFEFESFAPNIDNGVLLISAADGLFMYFCVMTICFAKGMLCMFLCMLFKREYIVIILMAIFWFGFVDLLLEVVMGIDKAKYFIKNFTIYGIESYVVGNGNISISQMAKFVYVLLGYSGIFTILGWLCFVKRSY